MNHVLRRVRFLLPHSPQPPAAMFFHSTPVLGRRRNSKWFAQRFNGYATRFRRKEAKRALLRDAKIYLDQLVQGFHNPRQDGSESSSSYISWFERQYFGNGRASNHFHSQQSQWGASTNRKRRSGKLWWSDSDEEDLDSVFGSPFEAKQVFYWSFNDETFHWEQPRHRSKRVFHDWKDDIGNEDDPSTESDLASDCQALGLSASGHLKLEDIKNAYRTCALRWHPDRHQGSSKEMAEEKFKHCTAAYKSLCDKLAAA